MKIDKFIALVRGMGFTATLWDDGENYYIDEDPQLRIHFDVDTKEVYPIFYYKSRKYFKIRGGRRIKLRFPRDLKPLTQEEVIKRLKRLKNK